MNFLDWGDLVKNVGSLIILNGYHLSDPWIGIETPHARPGWNPNTDTCPHQL